MAVRRNLPSEYQAMWLFAMFDLPVLTSQQRRNYAQFRKALLKHGFFKIQYSVYARYCSSEESASTHIAMVSPALPPEGQVRFLLVTERQFGKMVVITRGKPSKPEKAPRQLQLF